MPKRYAKQTLRRLRNEIPINILIADILELPHKTVEGYFRFLCPRCGGFDTATNPKTNLARCFSCQENFNPIDLTMIVKRQNFRCRHVVRYGPTSERTQPETSRSNPRRYSGPPV